MVNIDNVGGYDIPKPVKFTAADARKIFNDRTMLIVNEIIVDIKEAAVKSNQKIFYRTFPDPVIAEMKNRGFKVVVYEGGFRDEPSTTISW